MPTLSFTAGDDSYTVSAPGNYDLNFLAGNDTLVVNGGTFTTAHMGDGNDSASLRSGDAAVFGGLGADRFEIYATGTEADGGGDNDLFNLRGASGVEISGGAGDDRFNFYGDSASVTLHGGDGNDDYFGYGRAISGTLHGDFGNDYFVGFSGGGALTIAGGGGNDIYRYHSGASVDFVEIPNEGIDAIQVARGVNYTLPTEIERISVQGFSGSVAGAAILGGNGLDNIITAHDNVDFIFGNDGNDKLFGKGADDTLTGGIGNDYLDGGTGNDTMLGGDGNDTLNGRAGNDTMTGGPGNDVYYVDSLLDLLLEEDVGGGSDTARVSVSDYELAANVENGIVTGSIGLSLSGNELDNSLTGGAGDDTLAGLGGNDSVRGGGGADEITPGEGNDYVSGGAGDDYAFGDAGNDTLLGDAGADQLYGGAGNDVLRGGAGADLLAGMDGDNRYAYVSLSDSTTDAPDSITWESSTDLLDLSALDANSGEPGNQAFTLRTGGAPTGAAGDLWYVYDAPGFVLNVYGDVNGDSVADFRIMIANLTTLAADDVLL